MSAIKVRHPEWARHAAIYQVNQRQLTREGTFDAAAAHLPRIAELGFEIVWLMPVHPIGERNRKGSLGSPYAVRDHRAVNPEFGTMDDLARFVETAHGLGLRVILDWVANHTAWDHHLVHEHPEWYARDWKGDLRPTPWWDWDDIVDLDFSHEGVREYMIEALERFVRSADVDGYRCDVAGFVPLDFWQEARRRLDAVKPVFMLAEWETRDLHDGAFDASYAWSWNHALHLIAQGASDIESLRVYYAWNERSWPHDSMRMTFVSNHDHNHAEGTEYERFGDALPLATVLSVVGDGIPLAYTGQDVGSRKRLAFFDKDVIDVIDEEQAELYRLLLALKKRCRPLWNSPWGGRMVRVPNSEEAHALSFVRQVDDEAVLGVFNLSPDARTLTFGSGPHHGAFVDAFTDEQVVVDGETQMALPPWGYRVLVR